MIRMGVSVVLAVKNEEANLERCLESVRWADEIVVVDNESTDNTIRIAKNYTNKIYSFKDKALIPKIQQFGIEKATQEWILVLDGDIVVPKITKDEMLKKTKNKDINAYYLNHLSYFFNGFTKSKCWGFWNVKLFRRGFGSYKSERPHCPLVIKGLTGRIKNPLLHYAFPDIKTFLRKTDLYTSQDAMLLSKGKKAGLLNKRIRRVNIYNLIIEPMTYGIYLFFIGRGFKDGFKGIVVSCLYSYYLFLERAKLWELTVRRRGDGRY